MHVRLCISLKLSTQYRLHVRALCFVFVCVCLSLNAVDEETHVFGFRLAHLRQNCTI